MRRAPPFALAALASLVVTTTPSPAEARPGGGSLWRHFACDFDAARREARSPASPTDGLSPVLRLSQRPHLEALGGEIHPLPLAEPVPARGPDAPVIDPPRLATPTRNDHRCVGMIRGTPALLAKVARIAQDPAADIDDEPLKDAGWLGVAAAAPSLRAIVARRTRPEEADEHRGLELTLHRATAAVALADIGDHDPATTSALVDFLVWQETHNVGFSYRESLEALSRIDPDALAKYAVAAFARLHDASAMSLEAPVRELVPWMKLAKGAALTVLERATGAYKEIPLSNSHDYCLVMGARLEAGDEKLARDVRKSARGSYSGTWLATCDAVWLGALLGSDVDDADIILRHLGRPDLGMDRGIARIAYEALVRVVGRAVREDFGRARAARATLLKGLRERSSWPHIADPTHVNYAPRLRAAHFAALAALGDAEGTKKLFALIDDPSDRTGAAPWGAAWAVQLGVPDAPSHALALLGREATYVDDGYAGGREELVETLAKAARGASGDAGWTAALVNAEPRARRDAIALFARSKPRGACDVVTKLAPHTSDESAEDAYWTLAMLGDACRAQAETVARDRSLDPAVRGMGLELSAMMRAPFVPAFVAEQEKKRETFYLAFVQRARLIQTLDP